MKRMFGFVAASSEGMESRKAVRSVFMDGMDSRLLSRHLAFEDVFLTAHEAVFVTVVFVESLRRSGGIGLVGGVVVSGDLAGLGFVEFVELGGTLLLFRR
jgi:hypothetical protein